MGSLWLLRGTFTDLRQDARYAVRTLRRNPGFTFAALLTLALGVGATTAVFSAVHGVLLRPLPYPSADRLVRVWEEHPGGTGTVARLRGLTNRTWHAWTAGMVSGDARAIDVLGGFLTNDGTVRVGDDDVRLSGAAVSPSLLAAVGASPLHGRLFTADDAEAKSEPVVLVSELFWRQLLSGAADAVGRRIVIDGRTHTIVGVVRGDLAFPEPRVRFWTPYVVQRVSTDPALSQRTSGLNAIARLSPGATSAQVEAEGTVAARSVPVTAATEALFGKGGPPIVRTTPLVADLTANIKPALLLLMAAVACLLLIACANVGNLCLSRGVSRQRELAVRAAIGAGQGRLVRQLLTESVIVSAAGGLLGLGLAWALIRVLPALAPARFPRLDDVRLDARVMAFAGLATLVTLLVAGVMPAWRGARFGLAESLHGGDGASAGGFRSPRARRMRDALLISESAFAIMLLVGAGLLARSFVRLVHVDAGYTTDRVLTARLLLPRETSAARASEILDAMLTRLRATPGIVAVGAGSMMPMVNITAITTFTLPGVTGATASRPAEQPQSRPSGPSGHDIAASATGSGATPVMVRTATYMVTPGYAEALGLRLRQGRFVEARDVNAGTRALVVNEEFVRQYLSRASPIGYRFSAGLFLDEKPIPTEIVGVVANVLKDGQDRRPQPEIYLAEGSHGHGIGRAVNLVVKTSSVPAALAPVVRQVIRDVDRAASIERIAPLSDQVSASASVSQPRFATAVLVTFAAIALALASIGLYGVLSYSVSQRRREFGVRAALGASRGRLMWLVLREGLARTAAGIALGLAGAAALTRLMQSALFGVTPLDPASFALAAALLLAVAIAACLIPGARAASANPAEAFRSM